MIEMKFRRIKRAYVLPLLGASVSLLTACASENHTVIAATGTTVGVEIGQDPTAGATAVLGYKRAEFARVPSNRPNDKSDGSVVENPKGADQTGEVLMELHYTGLENNNGIYQRLAVGKTAVQQPGASLMFARDAEGKIDADTAKAISAVKGIPVAPSGDKLSSLNNIASAYANADSTKKGKIDAIIASKTGGAYADYQQLLLNDDKVDLGTLQAIEKEMKTQNLVL